MSPTDFEQFSLNVLHQQLKGLENVEFEHNVVVKRPDGSYQIDGIIHFDVMGVRYTTLVECKHHSAPISRDKVEVLYNRIHAMGAHKGILISTSNFQRGTIQYATEHGIALIQIADAEPNIEVRGHDAYRIIQNRPNLYNGGDPYIAVMQIATDNGISCAYLRHSNDSLRAFLTKLPNE